VLADVDHEIPVLLGSAVDAGAGLCAKDGVELLVSGARGLFTGLRRGRGALARRCLAQYRETSWPGLRLPSCSYRRGHFNPVGRVLHETTAIDIAA
jgi:hypothetical protein